MRNNKYSVKISEKLLSDIKTISKDENFKVDKIVEDALKDYVNKYKELSAGYKEWGKFNSDFAEMCLVADNETLKASEEKLSESELSDS